MTIATCLRGIIHGLLPPLVHWSDRSLSLNRIRVEIPALSALSKKGHYSVPVSIQTHYRGDRRQKKFAEKGRIGYIFPMSRNKEDVKLAQDYIAGEAAAVKQVNGFIEMFFRSWSVKFGYEKDDIISDVRYKLYMSLSNKEFEFRSGLRTYIKQIVDHTSIDYLRFRKRVEKVDPDDAGLIDNAPSAEENLIRKDAGKLIYRVLRLVPKECLGLWRMRLKRGMSCAEIGAEIDKSEGNIRRKLWACRESAKEIREKLLKKDKPF